MLRIALGFRGTDTHGLKAFRRERLLDVARACVVEKDLFASEFVIRASRMGRKVTGDPDRGPREAADRRSTSRAASRRCSRISARLVWVIRDPEPLMGRRWSRSRSTWTRSTSTAASIGLPDTLTERARDVDAGAGDGAVLPTLCAAWAMRGTLFVVGRDVAARTRPRRAEARRRRPGTSSPATRSPTTTRSPAGPRRRSTTISGARTTVLQALTGARPVGFRAPGYTLSPALIEAVTARGYRYDSSLLPSPPYYAAKAAVIGALAVLGRTSRSILGAVGQLFRPRGPAPRPDRFPGAAHRGASRDSDSPSTAAVLASLPETATALTGRDAHARSAGRHRAARRGFCATRATGFRRSCLPGSGTCVSLLPSSGAGLSLPCDTCSRGAVV